MLFSLSNTHQKKGSKGTVYVSSFSGNVMPKVKALVVTVSGERPIHEVAHDLEAAGLNVDQVLDVIGSITGSADHAIVNKLKGISGVADVSEDHPVSVSVIRH